MRFTLQGEAPFRIACAAALEARAAAGRHDQPAASSWVRNAWPVRPSRAAVSTARLKEGLRAEGVQAIYVNDNFGDWKSDFRGLVTQCRRLGGPGARLVGLLRPQQDDLAVLKPRHSAFYGTPIEMLLQQLGARELIVTGLATELCVKFTAMDAFVRGYRLWIPADCTASESDDRKQEALTWMRLALKARVHDSAARSA